MADDSEEKKPKRAALGAPRGRLLGAELERAAGAELVGAQPLDGSFAELTYPGRREGARERPTRERPTGAERARRMLEQLHGGRRATKRAHEPSDESDTTEPSTLADAADTSTRGRRETKRERRKQRRKE